LPPQSRSAARKTIEEYPRATLHGT